MGFIGLTSVLRFNGILLFIFMSFLCLTASYSKAQADSLKNTIRNEAAIKGIAFDDFWDLVKQQGKDWAGDKLFVRKIVSGKAKGFEKRDGLAPSWEAQIIRCDELAEHVDPGRHLSVCKGKSLTLRMTNKSETDKDESDPGPNIEVAKRGNFRGAAIAFERIKITAQGAESIANSHMHYRSNGCENYFYDLKIDVFSNAPVWVIKKACSPRGLRERCCRPKEHWIVKIDGETGQIIR